jgi:deazaflavin-dependent oxidoreductase (nitroreductase family)
MVAEGAPGAALTARLRAVPLPDLAYRMIGRFSVTRFDRLVHPLLYRLTAGRGPLGHIFGADMLLLTTVGRRSGRPRTVALFGFASDAGWIVIGSSGGRGTIPAWYRNLVADPSVRVQVGDTAVAATAVELSGPAYEAAFELAAAAYPGYRVYRRRATHHIPVVRLVPDPAGSAPERSPT